MYYEWLLSIALLIGFVTATRAVARILMAVAKRKEAAPKRAIYISKVFNFGIATLAFFLLTLVWSIDYSGLLVLASSVLAVIGIAFFAQWSILSNVTASIVIFFTYPAKIGDHIKIVDAEDTIEGEIVDINLFQVLIRDGDGNLVNYPNNLIITKPLVKMLSASAGKDALDDVADNPDLGRE